MALSKIIHCPKCDGLVYVYSTYGPTSDAEEIASCEKCGWDSEGNHLQLKEAVTLKQL